MTRPLSIMPNRASPEGTSGPLPDPHKDGGRPESHGGTVHAPQLGARGSVMSEDSKRALGDLARKAITAQQYGNLASKRHTSGAVHELGDKMVLTNSRISRALSALDPGRAEQMPPWDRGTFDNLARTADEMQFGISVAQWVAQTYPHTISLLEKLGQTPELKDVSSTAIPDLQAQLSDAETILQTAAAAPTGQPATTGAVGVGSSPAKSD